MLKLNPQKGVIKISITVAIVIVAAVVAATSVIVVSKYYEGLNNISPVAAVTPVSTPSATPTPTLIIDPEIADWKTYRNEEYGFEFQYPQELNDLKKYGDAGISILVDDIGSYINIRKFELKKGQSVEDIIVSNTTFGPNEDTHPDFAEVSKSEKIGKENFYCFSYIKSKYGRSCWTKEPVILQFELSAENVKMPFVFFNQILSTFKFTEKDNSFSCGTSTVADLDNNIYNTVQIGEQCWLKENLKVTQNPEGKIITRYCYDNDLKNCETDGGLYDWNTAMNNSVQEGAQGICPTGFHIPTDAEQYTLENYLKDGANSCVSTRTGWDCNTAGTKLKSGGSSGFAGILAGGRYTGGSFDYRGANAAFWSSTESGASAWRRSLGSGYSAVYRYAFDKAYGFSVRCLKN